MLNPSLLSFPFQNPYVNPNAHVVGYAAAESGTRLLAFTQTLTRSTSPGPTPDSTDMSEPVLAFLPAAPSPKRKRFVPTNPSCGSRSNGRSNFNEYNPECASSSVTIVFSYPWVISPLLPPLGGNQYIHPLGTPTDVFQFCPAQAPPRPYSMKSSAHTVPVASFPPTNFMIVVHESTGRIVAPTSFVSATNPPLLATL